LEVQWNDPALQHLEDIRRGLAELSASAADALVARLIERTAQLSVFPESGALLAGHESVRLRFLVEGDYRIVYVVIRGQVEILGVVRTARRSL
jgi:plasmid stabilization system protein ParE